MRIVISFIFAFFLFVARAEKEPPRFYGCNIVAYTLLEVKSVTSTTEFVNTGFALTVLKQANDSQLSYDAQITYQFTESLPYGVLFQMRVKDAETGEYIRAETGSRGVGVGAYAGNTIPLFDTTYDFRTGKEPLAGTYTYELWCKVGGGECQVIPYESTIRVMEAPRLRSEEK